MIRFSRSSSWAWAALALALPCGTALADGSVPDPGMAAEEPTRPILSGRRPTLDRDGLVRPRRRVTGGPDYVGSDYGLGKPSFYGIGSRPDWGRSSID